MYKNTIINLIVIAILAAGGWFGLRPMVGDIVDLRGMIKVKEEAIIRQQQAVDKLNAASQLLDSNKETLEKLKQALPEAAQVPELIVVMDNLASQNGLSLSGLDIVLPQAEQARPRGGEAPSAPVSPFRTIKINFNASGTYGAFKSWLKSVENNLLLMDVGRISFKILEKKTTGGEVSANINPVIDFVVGVDTYVLKK